ncbi:hypothetical protein HBH82_245410 [Parastagonospora nodorum]|nr:hypothetical protein HBH82_245410 [Parastagonospora nodorum]KAH4658626.1 hypothetical protein HBH78_239580 [Parastagonospora nodorum]KAH4691450.1 hypothetical protein HBH67_244250 [Parastagonospora nodorum]KAH4751417.1 hypothetical protein HBH63_242100 [Parastagonospora nodorum]KAH4776062.1 hypothetical protein HBH62_176620 [Parastagonospora nodorum]
MTDSPRARTPINLSAVLYEHNIDLDFVPSVAFISDVHMADSLRARTLINLSAVLYEQAAARTSLSAEVGNMDLDFVPGVAFISNVYIADSLRARTPINLSAVLLRARTLINPSAVLYEQVSIIDLDFVPGVAFDAIGNVELTGDLLGDADRVNNNNNNERIALPAKRIKTDEDCKKSTHFGDNMEELICVGKVKHTYQGRIKVSFCRAGNNCNNLNIMVTNLTGREFGRVNMKSSTGLSGEGPLGLLFLGLISMTLYKFYKGKNIQLLRPFTQQELIPRELGSIYVLRSVDKIRADVADVFDTVISKLDKVPTQELSSHIKTELYPHQKLRDNSCKFYCLVITGEDTHYKQTIKKAYIMLLERALLILFMT